MKDTKDLLKDVGTILTEYVIILGVAYGIFVGVFKLAQDVSILATATVFIIIILILHELQIRELKRSV